MSTTFRRKRHRSTRFREKTPGRANTEEGARRGSEKAADRYRRRGIETSGSSGPAGDYSIVTAWCDRASSAVGEPRLSVYSAAKAGVIGFTKALAREVGRYNIMINCVALGTTKTERMKSILERMPGQEEKMTKAYALKRIGETDDAANVLLLMSSDYVTWITGQTLSSSGGFSFVG